MANAAVRLEQVLRIADALKAEEDEAALRFWLGSLNSDPDFAENVIRLARWKENPSPEAEKEILDFARRKGTYLFFEQMYRLLKSLGKWQRAAEILTSYSQTIEESKNLSDDQKKKAFARVSFLRDQFDIETPNQYERSTTKTGNVDTLHSKEQIDPSVVLHGNWYNGSEINFFPLEISSNDKFKDSVRKHIVPPAKFHLRLSGDSKFLTFGSCFAANVRQSLKRRGYHAGNVEVAEGLNNAFALDRYLEMVIDGGVDQSTWYTKDDAGRLVRQNHEARRDAVLTELAKADCVVLTYGLSEVWRDAVTGEVFWMGVPQELFEKGRHVFSRTTVQENLEAITRTLTRLTSFNPSLQVVVTVSPIPLNATFSEETCIVADARSKSVLRSAVAEAMDNLNCERVHYWPSFEAFRWLGSHVDYPTIRKKDARHPDPALIDAVIELFLETVLP